MTTHDSGWKKFYADIIKTYNCGYSVILGRFSGILNLFFTVATFFLVKGLDLGYFQIIIIFIFLFAILMGMGHAYLKLDLQKSEFSSNFKEQPELIEMKADIKQIKELLEQQRKI
jgi:hypothetical protein